jgi:ELWxxDGT repeat protein
LCVFDGVASTRFLDLNAHQLTVAAGSLFFLTDPGTLWRSRDGLAVTVAHSSAGAVSLLVANERSLVYWADGALWRITAADAAPRRIGDQPQRVPGAAELGGTLFFIGFDPAHGNELWKSTADGAVERVTDLTPGPASSLTASELVVAGERLFFVANLRQRVGLYSMREDDAAPTFRHEAWWYPQLTRVGAECAFAWDDTLWLASESGVREAARGEHLWALSVARGRLHYTSREGSSDVLWRLDDAGPRELHRFSEQLFSVTPLDDALYFRGADATAGSEPWVVRGDEVSRIADLAAGPASSLPANFRELTSLR